MNAGAYKRSSRSLICMDAWCMRYGFNENATPLCRFVYWSSGAMRILAEIQRRDNETMPNSWSHFRYILNCLHLHLFYYISSKTFPRETRNRLSNGRNAFFWGIASQKHFNWISFAVMRRRIRVSKKRSNALYLVTQFSIVICYRV